MREHLTVSEAARRLGCRPRDISDALYHRVIPDEACPLIGGRRLIPTDVLPRVRAVLEERATRRRGGTSCTL
jgi:hypothetical protein